MRPDRSIARIPRVGAQTGNELAAVVANLNRFARGVNYDVPAIARDARIEERRARLLINRNAVDLRATPGQGLIRIFEGNRLAAVRLPTGTLQDAADLSSNIVREERRAMLHTLRAGRLRALNAGLIGRDRFDVRIEEARAEAFREGDLYTAAEQRAIVAYRRTRVARAQAARNLRVVR